MSWGQTVSGVTARHVRGRTMARVSTQDDNERHSRASTPVTAMGADDALLTAAPTALPSVLARAVAFGAIVIAAVCGGLAGYATSILQCAEGCIGPTLGGSAIGAAIGALAAAAGVAALAALVLRSMSEWADQASARRRQHSSARLRRHGSRTRRGPRDAQSDDKAVRH